MRATTARSRSSASCGSLRPGRPSRRSADNRQHGASETTYYRWNAPYGGLEVSQLRRLRQLEEENRKLKPKGSGLRGPPIFGWSTVETRVALTYTSV